MKTWTKGEQWGYPAQFLADTDYVIVQRSDDTWTLYSDNGPITNGTLGDVKAWAESLCHEE